MEILLSRRLAILSAISNLYSQIVRMKWEGNDVKLCIEAPKDVVIERDKVYEKRCMEEGIKAKWQFDKLVKDKRKHLSRPRIPILNE